MSHAPPAAWCRADTSGKCPFSATDCISAIAFAAGLAAMNGREDPRPADVRRHVRRARPDHHPDRRLRAVAARTSTAPQSYAVPQAPAFPRALPDPLVLLRSARYHTERAGRAVLRRETDCPGVQLSRSRDRQGRLDDRLRTKPRTSSAACLVAARRCSKAAAPIPISSPAAPPSRISAPR